MTPKKLQYLFIIISFIGAGLILVFSYLGMSKSLNQYNIAAAQRSSINIGYALFKLEQQTLIDQENDRLRSEIPKEHFSAFDARMRKLLKPMGILKIKIFSTDKTIIYSTDRRLIGLTDKDNEQLDHAIQGQLHSELELKESIVDLDNEQRFKVDVVETYLPMRDLGDRVKGVYEVDSRGRISKQ